MALNSPASRLNISAILEQVSPFSASVTALQLATAAFGAEKTYPIISKKKPCLHIYVRKQFIYLNLTTSYCQIIKLINSECEYIEDRIIIKPNSRNEKQLYIFCHFFQCANTRTSLSRQLVLKT